MSEPSQADPSPAPVTTPRRVRTLTMEWGLSAAALGLIGLGCVWILRPFLTSMLWATILSLAVWPLQRRLRDRFGGRSAPAAVLTVLLLGTVLLLPIAFLAANLAGGVGDAVRWAREMAAHPVAEAPTWLAGLPLVGAGIAQHWTEWISRMDVAFAKAGAFLVQQSGWMLRQGLALTRGIFDLGMSLLFVFFMLLHGEQAAREAAKVAERLGGARGHRLLDTAVKTIHATLLGSLGTALAQAVLAFIGFVIVGAPSPLLLATAVFFLSMIPVGAPVIWIPLAIWMFIAGHTGKAVFLVLWCAVVVGSVDNVLRPWLTKRTAQLPFLLVLIGVIGGAAGFGVIGLFLGPALLAVGFSLLREWIRTRPASADEPAPSPASPPASPAA